MIDSSNLLLILITLLSTYPGVLIIIFLLKERGKNKVEIEKIIDEDSLKKMYERSLGRLEDKLFDSISKNFDQFLFELGDELLSELDVRAEVKKLRQKIEQQSNEYTNYLKTEAQKSSQTLNQQTTAYLQRLQESVKHNRSLLEQKTTQYLKETQTTLAEETSKVIKGAEAQLREDLERARQEIRTYEKQKKQAVDERAVALLEEALELALKKKLSPTEHKKIIYEALEDAKKEGFFG